VSELLHVAAALAMGCVVAVTGCHSPSPAPTPTPPAPDAAVDPGVAIYRELVGAGCLAPDPDDAGPASLDEEYASVDAPSWLGCLYDGGSISSCDVPCDTDGGIE
jgi:hypothetical protein